MRFLRASVLVVALLTLAAPGATASGGPPPPVEAALERTLEEGLALLRRNRDGNDYSGGLRRLRQASNAGLARASRALGVLYLKGRYGVAQSSRAARHFLELAASQGDEKSVAWLRKNPGGEPLTYTRGRRTRRLPPEAALPNVLVVDDQVVMIDDTHPDGQIGARPPGGSPSSGSSNTLNQSSRPARLPAPRLDPTQPLQPVDRDLRARFLEGPGPILVVADSPYCGPCRRYEPILHEVLDGRDDVELRVLDVSKGNNVELLRALGARATPTSFLFRGDGTEVARFSGAVPAASLRAFLDEQLPAASGGASGD